MGIEGSGLRFEGLEIKVPGPSFGNWVSRFEFVFGVWGLGSGVWGLECGVWGLSFHSEKGTDQCSFLCSPRFSDPTTRNPKLST